MKSASNYKVVSYLLYGAYFYLGVPLTIAAVILLGEFLPDGGWGVAGTILLGLVGLCLFYVGFEKLRRARSDGYYRRCFPGYAGSRFPIFHLLEWAGPPGDEAMTRQDVIYSLGEAEECFFVLRNGKSDEPHKLFGGIVMRHTVMRHFMILPKEQIVAVEVIERSDAEIAGSAVDTRDYAERAGSLIAQRITGARVKTRIIPFAAYLVVTLRGAYGDSRLVAAVPTGVTDDMLRAMGEQIAEQRADGGWLADKAVAKAKKYARDEIEEQAGALVGDDTVDLVNEGLDWVKEGQTWLDPDKASIGSINGAKGRRMARLIADRIRGPVGLAVSEAPSAGVPPPT